MVMDAARQAFDASKAAGETRSFDQFLAENRITVDEAGTLRTNPRDIVAEFDRYYRLGDTPSAFKSEFGERVGAMNAIIDHASRSTNGYGFDAKGQLMYGDGSGLLQNTRPQEALSALALDTVGYRIQEAMRGNDLDHAAVAGRIDAVTISNQGETSTWKQILSSGHYSPRLYGFTGTPDSIVLDAKLSLGMTLKVPNPDFTGRNLIFGENAVREFAWRKVSALANMVLGDLAEGQAARVILDVKEIGRERVLQQVLSEAKRMGSDVEVILVNNDNNVAESKKVQVFKDGVYSHSLEGDPSASAIEKFTGEYSLKNRGTKRFIMVYDQSGRGTDIKAYLRRIS